MDMKYAGSRKATTNPPNFPSRDEMILATVMTESFWRDMNGGEMYRVEISG